MIIPIPMRCVCVWHLQAEDLEVTYENGTSRPLILVNAAPARVAATSSAAFALAASPHALEKLAGWSVSMLLGTNRADLVKALRTQLATAFEPGQEVDQCLPKLVEKLPVSIPLQGGGRYNLADGAFAENNGAAFTLAQMQKDCARPGSDALACAQTPKIVVCDHTPRIQPGRNPIALNILFSDYTEPTIGSVVPEWRE